MRPIGYSTGSLGKADFRWALQVLATVKVTCVELSALRIGELAVLVEAIDDLDLSGYEYISFHAPSSFGTVPEEEVIEQLMPIHHRGWPIIIHPDAISQPGLWHALGGSLCIENMDKRKPTGRNIGELAAVFEGLPEAGLCFDIAHAQQIDPTMSQAALILRVFGDRLRQVHISSLDVRSAHHRLSLSAIPAYRRVSHLIPEHIPLIVESPLMDGESDAPEGVRRELARAREALPV